MNSLIRLIALLIVFTLAACSSKPSHMSAILEDKKSGLDVTIHAEVVEPELSFFLDDDLKARLLCFGEDCLGVAEDTDTLLEAKSDGFYQTFEGSAYCGFGGMAGFWGVLFPVGAEENGIFIGNYSDLNFKECRLSEAFSPKTGQWLGAVESKPGAHIPLFFMTAGTYWFSTIGLSKREFSWQQYKSVINSSLAETVRAKIYQKHGQIPPEGLVPVIYVEEEDVEDNLEDALDMVMDYRELNPKESNIAGILFLEHETGQYLSYVAIDEFKTREQSIDRVIKQQAKHIYKEFGDQTNTLIQQADIDAYIPPRVTKPSVPRKPECVKDEFETKAKFESRCIDIVNAYVERVAKIQQHYNDDILKRNQLVEKVTQEFQSDRSSAIRLAEELNQEVPELLELLFAANAEYRIKALRYNAEDEYLYFTLFSPQASFSKKARAEMSARFAKNIKKDNAYKIIPDIDRDDGVVKVAGFEIMDLKTEREFDIEFTDINYQPEVVKTNIEIGNVQVWDDLQQKVFSPHMQSYELLADLSSSSITHDVKSRINQRPPEWYSGCFGHSLYVCQHAESEAEALDEARKELAKRIQLRVVSLSETAIENVNDYSDSSYKEKASLESDVELTYKDYKQVQSVPKEDGYWYVAIKCTSCGEN